MERNQAAARHSWARQHAWMLLRFFPFPVGHPEHEHCSCRLGKPFQDHDLPDLYARAIPMGDVYTVHSAGPIFVTVMGYCFLGETFGVFEIGNIAMVLLGE